MTANDDSRYQTLLQVAAGTRRRATTADVNITYTASVAAVARTTPTDKTGSTPNIITRLAIWTSDDGAMKVRALEYMIAIKGAELRALADARLGATRVAQLWPPDYGSNAGRTTRLHTAPGSFSQLRGAIRTHAFRGAPSARKPIHNTG